MNTIYCSQDGAAREEEKSAAEEKRDVRRIISRAISTYTESKLKL